MNYFAVTYSYQVNDERIIRLRPAHRKFIGELSTTGKIIGSGPFSDNAGGALIVLSLSSESSLSNAEEIMNKDPFYVEEVLDSRTIRPWNPVINSFE